MFTLIYLTLVMLTSPFVGFALSKLLKDEADLVKFYFPVILWTLAIVTAVFLTINTHYALTTAYLFLMTFTWLKTSR